MDALGFVLTAVGTAMVVWQFLYLVAAVAIFSALAGKATKANVNFHFGTVGIALALAGVLVSHFG